MPIIALAWFCLYTLTFNGIRDNLTQASGSPYYPLSRDSFWKYEIMRPGQKKTSHVTWRITKMTQTKDGALFQVWPTPMEVDDEAMELIPLLGGIKENSTGSWIIKSPLRKDERWSGNGQA